MPASRASQGLSSAAYALIIFVVLFLAATVLAVMFYINNEQLAKDASVARKELANIGKSAELAEIRPLTLQRGPTAVRQITAEMRYLAGVIIGDPLADVMLTAIRPQVDNRLAPIYEQLDQLRQQDPYLGPADKADGLVTITETLFASRDYWFQRTTDTQQELDTHTFVHSQELQRLQNDLASLTAQLDQAGKAANTYQADTKRLLAEQAEKYDQLLTDLRQTSDQALAEKNAAVKGSTAMADEIDKFQIEVKTLKDRLQKFQPNPEQEAAALEPDGYVVQVVPRDKIAYINLAANDHIYRGLTFSVYDGFGDIPKTGQGKATLEVIEIAEMISKCRIVDFDPTNPIMEKDIIASLIWARDKQYLFCVAGDFDFNLDGQIEQADQDRVIKLIERWGGRVSSALSVETDFLVLGHPPETPERPADEFLGLNEQQAGLYQQARQRSEAYQDIRQDAAALGVPTFNLTRFLHFVGYYTQALATR